MMSFAFLGVTLWLALAGVAFAMTVVMRPGRRLRFVVVVASLAWLMAVTAVAWLTGARWPAVFAAAALAVWGWDVWKRRRRAATVAAAP